MELLADFQANLGHVAQGKTVLHWALAAGHPAVVQLLVKLGADLEATDEVSSHLLADLNIEGM